MTNNTALQQRFDERKKDFIDCVQRLEDAVAQTENSFIRDSVIKRYECAWETGWKMLKLWLSYQGIITSSPREVWKEAFAGQLLEGTADQWGKAQKMRNLTVHTYDEALAQEVYDFICDDAIVILSALRNKVLEWNISNS